MKSRMKCSFCCSHVSRLESLVFLWPRRVFRGSCKTSPFWRFPSRLSCRFAWQAWHFMTFQPVLYRVEGVKIGGSLARNARFDAPTCLVSSLSLVFLWPRRVFRGSYKTSPCRRVFKQVVMSFCVAGVALYDIPTCFIPCRKCQNLEEVSHEMLVLMLPHVSSRVSGFHCGTRRVTLGEAAKPLHLSTGFTLYRLSLLVLSWQASTLCDTPHSLLYTPHSTLHTPHYTFHSTLHTPHSTLYTPHSTLYTLLHSTLHSNTLHFTLLTPHSSLHTLHFTLHTLHSALYTSHSTLHTLHCTLLTSHFTLHTLHSTLYTLHSTLHTLHFTLYTPHSSLHTLHSTLHTLHSTLHTLHSTL